MSSTKRSSKLARRVSQTCLIISKFFREACNQISRIMTFGAVATMKLLSIVLAPDEAVEDIIFDYITESEIVGWLKSQNVTDTET